MANLASKMAKMTFDLAGKARPNKPDKQVLDAIQGAVTKALGPGYSVNVYSGKENAGYQHGANRHKTGLAADVHIVGPDGQTLTASKNKQQLLDVAKAFKELGGLGVGLGTNYMQGNGIHLDMFEPGPGQDTAWGNIGNANQSWLDSFYRSPIQAALPDTMQAPLSLAQTQMRDEAIRTAFASPTRALDVLSRPALAMNLPSRPATPTPTAALNRISPPSRFPGVPVGQVTRSPLGAIPASLQAAPVGRVTRAPLGPIAQFTQPARSLQHPTSVAPPTRLAAAPIGKVTKGPALAPAVDTRALAAQYAQYQPSKVTQMPTVRGMPSIPAPTGLPPAKPVAQPLAHPISVPPAPVLAPMLAPPTVVRDYPVADYQAPTQAPRATAYDVYNGLADTALDNTGKNTVGRLSNGTTTVTNKYGVTTGMTPYGKQTAVGSLPGIEGPSSGGLLSGMFNGGKPKSLQEQQNSRALKSTLGLGILGTAIAGPLGGLVGALAGRQLSKPGGLLSGLRNIDTSNIGSVTLPNGQTFNFGATTAFAKPQGGGAFPDAPSGGYRGSASFSNRSAEGMRGISPGAAAAIGRGQGGLY